MKTITVKTNGPILHHKTGAEVEIETDGRGTPLDFHWRRRLKAGDCVIVTKPAAKPVTRRRAPETEEGSE